MSWTARARWWRGRLHGTSPQVRAPGHHKPYISCSPPHVITFLDSVHSAITLSCSQSDLRPWNFIISRALSFKVGSQHKDVSSSNRKIRHDLFCMPENEHNSAFFGRGECLRMCCTSHLGFAHHGKTQMWVLIVQNRLVPWDVACRYHLCGQSYQRGLLVLGRPQGQGVRWGHSCWRSPGLHASFPERWKNLSLIVAVITLALMRILKCCIHQCMISWLHDVAHHVQIKRNRAGDPWCADYWMT